jgi:hypothetical protein
MLGMTIISAGELLVFQNPAVLVESSGAVREQE